MKKRTQRWRVVRKAGTGERPSVVNMGYVAKPPIQHPGIPELSQLSDQYRADKGITTPQVPPVKSVDPQYSARLAAAYHGLKHEPNDPVVKASYDSLKRETAQQFETLVGHGYRYQPQTEPEDGYQSSGAMMDAMRGKALKVYRTLDTNGRIIGFGADPVHLDHPMLEPAPYRWHDGHQMTHNDVFRFVHDMFGHGVHGYGFEDEPGEENAWRHHVSMYSPAARGALATETRGQANWFWHGPHTLASDGTVPGEGDPGFVPVEKRPFAPQKGTILPSRYHVAKSINMAQERRAGLLPEEFWNPDQAEITKGVVVLTKAVEQGEVPLYSNLSHVVSTKLPHRFSGQQLRGVTSGVSPEEVRYSGTAQHFAEPMVTKEQVLNTAQQHLPQVRDIIKSGPDTRFRKYSTPGTDNYQEHLLHWSNAPDGTHFVDPQRGHFTEPNILAQLRYGQGKDAEGNPVTHVEEIQSPWHQQGRKSGYLGALPRREPTPDAADPVPDAPFKKTWHELAFKRAIAQAVQNGSTRLTWTTGDTQAGRYGPSTQRGMRGFYDDMLLQYAQKLGKQFGAQTGKTELAHANNSNPAIMDAIFTGKNNLYTRQRSGADIPEGHAQEENHLWNEFFLHRDKMPLYNFYRQSGDIEDDTALTSTANRPQVHHLDITPAMREHVQDRGLPLWGVSDAATRKAIMVITKGVEPEHPWITAAMLGVQNASPATPSNTRHAFAMAEQYNLPQGVDTQKAVLDQESLGAWDHGVVSMEATPGQRFRVFDNAKNAPIEERRQFTHRVLRGLYGRSEGGNPKAAAQVLAGAIGLPIKTIYRSPGAYVENGVMTNNPAFHAVVPVHPRDSEGPINPLLLPKIRRYAAGMAKLLDQEAVGYTKVYPGGPQAEGHAHAFVIQPSVMDDKPDGTRGPRYHKGDAVGRGMTQPETEALARALGTYAVIGHRRGAILLHWGAGDDAALQHVTSAIHSVWPGDQHITLHHSGAADSDLVSPEEFEHNGDHPDSTPHHPAPTVSGDYNRHRRNVEAIQDQWGHDFPSWSPGNRIPDTTEGDGNGPDPLEKGLIVITKAVDPEQSTGHQVGQWMLDHYGEHFPDDSVHAGFITLDGRLARQGANLQDGERYQSTHKEAAGQALMALSLPPGPNPLVTALGHGLVRYRVDPKGTIVNADVPLTQAQKSALLLLHPRGTSFNGEGSSNDSPNWGDTPRKFINATDRLASDDLAKGLVVITKGIETEHPWITSAKEKFGTTRDPREAGYVLPNGEMLDFSGRHRYAADDKESRDSVAWHRGVDHSEVAAALPLGKRWRDFQFKTGAIRYSHDPSGATFADFHQPLTEPQRRVIMQTAPLSRSVQFEAIQPRRVAKTAHEFTDSARTIDSYGPDIVTPRGVRGCIQQAEQHFGPDVQKGLFRDGVVCRSCVASNPWGESHCHDCGEPLPGGVAAMRALLTIRQKRPAPLRGEPAAQRYDHNALLRPSEAPPQSRQATALLRPAVRLNITAPSTMLRPYQAPDTSEIAPLPLDTTGPRMETGGPR